MEDLRPGESAMNKWFTAWWFSHEYRVYMVTAVMTGDSSINGGLTAWWFGSEPVWPSGKALGWYSGKQRDLGSNPLRLSFLFKSCGLWTLSCDFVLTVNETLKWLSSLSTLMQRSFWWWQCSDRYIISLSPHRISLIVSVDVKHYVYFFLNKK